MKPYRICATVTVVTENVECMHAFEVMVLMEDGFTERMIQDFEGKLLDMAPSWKSIQIFHYEAV